MVAFEDLSLGEQIEKLPYTTEPKLMVNNVVTILCFQCGEVRLWPLGTQTSITCRKHMGNWGAYSYKRVRDPKGDLRTSNFGVQ